MTIDKNAQSDIGFNIKSTNGNGYTVYLSETEKKGPYKLYENLNYNAHGVHIKGLTNDKTYWANIVHTENGVPLPKANLSS